MDNDQEVVREPFEDNHILEQSDIADSVNACRSHTELYQDEICSPSDSCPSPESFAEDVKFAKTYGIDLIDSRKTKSNPIYDSLLKSNQFKGDLKTKDNSETMIKASVTSDCIYHKGTFYQKGDIVALCDQDDGQLYFAQITGFLQDQYCEKSASVNWLVPHKPTSREFFDPSAYKIGLEDVRLRKLDCMTFVRHCPHDYYIRNFFQSSGEESAKGQGDRLEVNLNERTKEKSYIWTTMKPCRVPQIETVTQCAAPSIAVSQEEHKSTPSAHAEISP